MPPKKIPDPAPVAPMTSRISDVVWQAIIAGVVTCVLAYIGQRAASKAQEAATRVEEVRATLEDTTKVTDTKLNDIAEVTTNTNKTASEVHTLVNSNMEVQLKISMVALRRLSQLTKDPDDIAAFEAAEKLYKEHIEKQSEVDGKK